MAAAVAPNLPLLGSTPPWVATEANEEELAARAGADAQFWEDALDKHNQELTRGDRSPRFVPNKTGTIVTGAELLAQAEEAKKRVESKRKTYKGQAQGFFIRVSEQLSRFARAVDVAVQQDSAASFVWGAIRAALIVIHDLAEATAVAIEGIHLILVYYPLWQEFATIYPGDARIREAIVVVYQRVLDFLLTTNHYLSRGAWKRLGQSVIASKTDRLRTKLNKVRFAAKVVDDEVKFRALQTNDYYWRLLLQMGATRITRRDATVTHALGSSSYNAQASETPMATLRWLAMFDEVIDDNIRFPTNGTCQWLPSDARFTTWIGPSNTRSLWIQGKPGCGKSVLSKALREHLRVTYSNSIIISWSFQGLARQASTTSSIAALLIYQVLQNFDLGAGQAAIQSSLTKTANDHPIGPHVCPFQRLWAIVLDVLRLLTQRHSPTQLFFVLDALDECTSRADELKTLLNELQKLSQRPQFRVALFSRPLGPTFENYASKSGTFCIPVLMSEEAVAHDILQFVTYELKALDSIPQRYHDLVIRQVASRAEGCFLWAKEYLEFLSGPCPDEVFKERLYHCPPGLWPIFDEMLSSVTASLNPTQKAHRNELLLLLCEAQTPLSLHEVGRVLRLGHYNPAKHVLDVGKPLVQVIGGFVRFVHQSVREFLTDQSRMNERDVGRRVCVTSAASHARLAAECLKCLLEPQYGSKGRIGQLLHHGFRNLVFPYYYKETLKDTNVQNEGMSFDYAWRYWEHHLTMVRDPELDLLRLAQDFLHSFQFAYWSEYTFYAQNDDLSTVRLTSQHLRTWFLRLPDSKKGHIRIEDFFSDPYSRLAEVYEEAQDDDRELQWLTLLRLIRYLIDVGKTSEALPISVKTTSGIIKLLGNDHPLALFARTQKAGLYMGEGRYLEANQDFKEIARIQQEVLGKKHMELYKTFLALGDSAYLLGRFQDSLASFDEAARGYKALEGVEGRFLQAQVGISRNFVQLEKLASAISRLVNVYEVRQRNFGKQDIFAATAQYMIGDIERRQGLKEDSLDKLARALVTHLELYPLSSIWSMDIAISILLTYRDFGMANEAREMLARLDDEGHVDAIFSRRCQVQHLRALLLWDDGRRGEATDLLQRLLIDADRDQYNRALMWVLLDQAVMLRAGGSDDDKRQAESNFDNILTGEAHDARGGESRGGPEPDPPRLLRLAEKALTLVRDRRADEADALLAAEKVKWTRPEDLWLIFGRPAADTGSMRRPGV